MVLTWLESHLEKYMYLDLHSLYMYMCMCLVAQLCLILCNLMDCSLPDSSVHGSFQVIILEWVAISYSEDIPYPGIEPMSLVSPVLAGRIFTTEPPGNPYIPFNFH